MTMTRFDISKAEKTPEEWSAIAFHQTTENNIQWNIAGGLILAAAAASATTPVTGLLIAAWSIVTSIDKARKIQRNQAAIREVGCIAHILEGDNFRGYLRQVGSEAIAAELNFASEQGYSFSDDALDYLESQQAAGKHLTQLPIATEPKHHHPQAAIATQSDTYKSDNSIDIIEQMTQRIGNCLIIGTPGSGKGMLLANAIRAAKAKYPDLKVFVIDPKASDQEKGYFDGVADVVKLLKCETADPKTVVEWLEKCFQEYYEYWEIHRRVLLVFDEGTLAGSKAKSAKSDIVKNTVIGLASAGDGEGRNIWITSLSPYIGDLGLNLNATSQLTAYALLTKNNLGSLKQWGKCSILEKITVEELSKLVEESPCDRAIFSGVSSKWYSMPTLHNYSAFDRDNRKPTGDALSTEDRQALRVATATKLKPAEAAMIQKLERTRYLTLEDFINQEIEASDRLPELLEAIALTIKKANHSGLLYKFKIG
ncbi:MAG: FtsK/SpoIIIE domain-containing protein [Cyanobacteriota bacterium]